MKVFEHPNFNNGEGCLVCGLPTDKPVVLVPIEGTGDGLTFEAMQLHLDCIDLRAIDGIGRIALIQTFKPQKRGE